MRARLQSISIIVMFMLTGCVARWEPQTGTRPLRLTHACRHRRAPLVQDFGQAGVRAIYSVVTQDASQAELNQLLQDVTRRQFAGAFGLTLNLNGIDTTFVQGVSALHDQTQVDEEFAAMCDMGTRHIYLTFVHYNPADQRNGPIRAR